MSHSVSTGRLRRRLLAPVLAVVAVTALASTPTLAQVATLGSPAPEEESGPAATEELSPQDGMLAYAECMRDNGIEVSDPVFDVAGAFVGGLEFAGGKDAGPKDEKGGAFAAASAACDPLLAAFKPAADPALVQEQTEAALRFAACMREQGLDWPDPSPEGSAFADVEIKIDKESAEFQAAFQACDDELALDPSAG